MSNEEYNNYVNSMMEASEGSRERQIQEKKNEIESTKNEQAAKSDQKQLELRQQELQVQQQQAQTQQTLVVGGLILAAVLVLVVSVYLITKLLRRNDTKKPRAGK